MIISIKDLTFSYGRVPVLKNINMELRQGEVLAVVGPNGAGKSTLLKCMNKLLEPQNGSIWLGGKNLKKMNRETVARYLGYVPQKSDNLFPFTVFDMVLIGRSPQMNWRCSKADLAKVLQALQLLGIEDLAMRNFNQLSGGQQQKVTIARALAQEAEVLLLDEPTSNLDILHQLETIELVRDLAQQGKLSAIISVHDLNLAARYADAVIMLKQGKIVASGKPFSVLTPETIADVYNVEVVVREEMGKPSIIPLRPLKTTAEAITA